MTQRDEGNNYRDSKNKAREYKRKQKVEEENEISSVLCDAYDIKDRIRAYGIKNKSKDAEGSKTTIDDCINDIITFLENLE